MAKRRIDLLDEKYAAKKKKKEIALSSVKFSEEFRLKT